MNVTRRICDAANLLANYPAVGSLGRIRNTRELPIAGAYILPYRVRRGATEIRRVLVGPEDGLKSNCPADSHRQRSRAKRKSPEVNGHAL
jgi:hypothetical protein